MPVNFCALFLFRLFYVVLEVNEICQCFCLNYILGFIGSVITKLFYYLLMEELNLVINGWLLEYELCNENSIFEVCLFCVVFTHWS